MRVKGNVNYVDHVYCHSDGIDMKVVVDETLRITFDAHTITIHKDGAKHLTKCDIKNVIETLADQLGKGKWMEDSIYDNQK